MKQNAPLRLLQIYLNGCVLPNAAISSGCWPNTQDLGTKFGSTDVLSGILGILGPHTNFPAEAHIAGAGPYLEPNGTP